MSSSNVASSACLLGDGYPRAVPVASLTEAVGYLVAINRNARRQRAVKRLDVNRDNGAPKTPDKKFSHQPS